MQHKNLKYAKKMLIYASKFSYSEEQENNMVLADRCKNYPPQHGNADNHGEEEEKVLQLLICHIFFFFERLPCGRKKDYFKLQWPKIFCFILYFELLNVFHGIFYKPIKYAFLVQKGN